MKTKKYFIFYLINFNNEVSAARRYVNVIGKLDCEEKLDELEKNLEKLRERETGQKCKIVVLNYFEV